MFRFKIALGFLLALALAAAGVYFPYVALNRLSSTVANAVRPDERLIRLKELIADVNLAESGVRTFSINNDEKYLEPYYKLLSGFEANTDSLRHLFHQNKTDIDSIAFLLREKLDSYDELIDLRYNGLIDDAMIQLNMQVAQADSQSEAALLQAQNQKPVKGVFGLINVKKYKLKQKELDSLLFIKQTQSASLKRKVEKIKEEHAAQMAELAARELELLEKDKIISKELLLKVKQLEAKILNDNKAFAEKMINDAKKQQRTLLYMSFAASVFILLLSIIIFADISQSNKYKKQLEVARNRAEQLAKFREEFLSNMSHELRTPVSAISGFSKKLKATQLGSEQMEYINNVSFASDHLLGIINDVLDIARIESGHLKLNESPFSILAVVQEVVNLLSIKALEKNIELNTEIESIKNITVNGDAMRLRQVLFNIIGNAIKFTSQGKVTVTIKTDNSKSNAAGKQFFRIIVTDTGIGIAPEKIKNIFTPFEQADMGVARKFGGTGLGLSISKKIIELHGGTIDVESKEGAGTTFYIGVPYEVVSITSDRKDIKHSGGETLQAKTHHKTLIGLKILLAEDDTLNSILQQSILTELGAESDVVANGEEVLMKLQTQKYDAVLMDLQMPEMGGIETTKRIREDLNSHIPVIAITANVHEAQKENCIVAGMNAVLIKPFTEQQIADAVIMALHHKTSHIVQVAEEEKPVEHDSAITKPYKLETLLKASNGNNDFVARMLKLFCMSGESLFLKAKEYLANNEVEKAGEQIHRLIPSCRQLHLTELSTTLKQLEDDCRENKNSANILLQLNNCYDYFKGISDLLNDEIAHLKN